MQGFLAKQCVVSFSIIVSVVLFLLQLLHKVLTFDRLTMIGREGGSLNLC